MGVITTQGIKFQLVANDTILDLFQDEEILLNYNVADIKDISKKNTNYSKTFRIPGTKNNNDFFNNIFEQTFTIVKIIKLQTN